MTKKHEWGPSRLNHGNFQCKGCGCTDLEARYALGDDCPGQTDVQKAQPVFQVIEGGKSRRPVDGMDLDYGTPMDEMRDD